METRPFNLIAAQALCDVSKVNKLVKKMLKITDKHCTSEVLFAISLIVAERVYLLEQQAEIKLNDTKEVFMETFKDLLDESLKDFILIENGK